MISLEQIGSFFVGGRRVRITDRPAETVTYSAGLSDEYDPNGTYLVESAYVQFFLPTARRFETPILLVHGGGLTGAQWENTPDGRPGWLTRFLEAGIACYVIDNVERGRAGFCAIDGEWPDRPLLRSDEESARLYRFGYAGHKFPMGAIDKLSAQTVPRWPSTRNLQADALVQAVDQIGPCALLGFSQGGGLAFQAADRRRETVKACVALEPHGVPTAFAPGIPGTPGAMVLGDFIKEDAFWRGLAAAGAEGMAAWRAAGGTSEVIRLPERGLAGNTHMMMMDSNSDAVFAVILEWLDGQHASGNLP
jgi:pimeloyl-ACP methyl ester carboxylesterase